MPRVAALYRYSVKGFTPEVCNSLSITAGGRVAGDWVLGVRFADTPEADDLWSRKTGMAAIPLEPVDRVEILSVMDNTLDVLMANTPIAKPARLERDKFSRPQLI